MFLPRVVSRLNLLFKVSGSLQNQSQALCSVVQHCHSTHFRALKYSNRCFTSAADNKLPPKLWTPLEPELEEVLVPRKLSVSPLESWLSLRYSLSPLLEASPPLDEGEILAKSMVLPPFAVPLLEDGESSTPLNCKNVLQNRRRKMNRNKYKKLLKRTKFLRRRVKDVRRKKKQAKFERDLARIVRRAGLKRAPDGWTAPKVYVRTSQTKRD
ncbi:aurora kinase A-interacting protein-like [Sinocyclocheilus anshuiensis]|uniref:Small ribosomal subunit protein mS38 n=1 Tax=Sinocyclocheilus anshuiensis TaxID=1608454 RepID=A0A671KZR7_9TELE|nr:PREDICTED: aurora kinase A-interacting protein-like [Sinocyclocheilus anshuiensis]XP_016333818.1 PREDICTED: aurora kinase A-interacting protein-like [Sinocyclocheilus anshuiensis]